MKFVKLPNGEKPFYIIDFGIEAIAIVIKGDFVKIYHWDKVAPTYNSVSIGELVKW